MKNAAGFRFSEAAARWAVSWASRRPAGPVQALALPELATIPWNGPPSARCFWQSSTGAALTAFLVKVPAAVQGRRENSRARSRRLRSCFSRRSQATPAASKPGTSVMPALSRVTVSWVIRGKIDAFAAHRAGSGQPGRLGVTEPQVHDLHRLAAGALDEIVEGGGEDEVAGAGVEHGGEVHPVGARDVRRVRRLAGRQNGDKRPAGVGGPPRGVEPGAAGTVIVVAMPRRMGARCGLNCTMTFVPAAADSCSSISARCRCLVS